MLEISAEIVEKQSERSKDEIFDNFLFQPGYATPKIDIRAAVVNNEKILLVQERLDQRWSMPGGWADVGEFPSEAIIRETKEESGFDVKPIKIIGIFDANRGGRPIEFFHAYKIIFLCELFGGEAKPSYETTAVDFFQFDQLPPLSINRTNHQHLDEIQKHLTDPNRLPFFD